MIYSPKLFRIIRKLLKLRFFDLFFINKFTNKNFLTSTRSQFSHAKLQNIFCVFSSSQFWMIESLSVISYSYSHFWNDNGYENILQKNIMDIMTMTTKPFAFYTISLFHTVTIICCIFFEDRETVFSCIFILF